MEPIAEGAVDKREEIKNKLRQCFDGKIVRKDLTKKIKEGANVPVYVLEFLLGQYCSSDEDAVIEQGVQNVKRILADNYVRPDESEKILSRLRQRGSLTVIDQVTVELNLQYDYYEARFSNLGLVDVPISDEYPEKYDRLLCGGIWSIIQLEYNNEQDSDIVLADRKPKKKNESLISIRKLTPIQMPHVDLAELKNARSSFTMDDYRSFVETYMRSSYTIGAMIIFPKHQNSINQRRGTNQYICDRWDLTLECIRRWYGGEESPLFGILDSDADFFKLFVSFKEYVDFFFLQDCVTDDCSKVKIWYGNGDFSEIYPMPKTVEEYLKWIDDQKEFVRLRNKRIEEFVKSTF